MKFFNKYISNKINYVCSNIKFFLNFISKKVRNISKSIAEYFFHMEKSTDEYYNFIDRLTAILFSIMLVLLSFVLLTVKLRKMTYKDKKKKYAALVLFICKFLSLQKYFIFFLVYFFSILGFFFILIVFIFLVYKIFFEKLLSYEGKNLIELINKSGLKSQRLNLLLIELWVYFLDLMVLLTFYLIGTAILAYGTVYFSKNYFIIVTISFLVFLLIFLYILNRIIPNVLNKLLLDIVPVVRFVSIIVMTIFTLILLISYLSQFPNEVLSTFLSTLTTLALTLLMLELGIGLPRVFKNVKSILIFLLKSIKILFGISLATINLFLNYYYVKHFFCFVIKPELFFPDSTILNILNNIDNTKYLIFIVVYIIIMFIWLKLEEKEFFSKIDCMVNFFCFLIYCLAFFSAVFIIFGLYMLILSNILAYMLIVIEAY